MVKHTTRVGMKLGWELEARQSADLKLTQAV